jgi:hypothetical protein
MAGCPRSTGSAALAYPRRTVSASQVADQRRHETHRPRSVRHHHNPRTRQLTAPAQLSVEAIQAGYEDGRVTTAVGVVAPDELAPTPALVFVLTHSCASHGSGNAPDAIKASASIAAMTSRDHQFPRRWGARRIRADTDLLSPAAARVAARARQVTRCAYCSLLRVVTPCCVMCRRGAPCRSGCGHMADGSGAEGAVHGTAGPGRRPGREQRLGGPAHRTRALLLSPEDRPARAGTGTAGRGGRSWRPRRGRRPL